MRLRRCCTRLFLLLLSGLALTQGSSARPRGPRVEVVCPTAPTTATFAEQRSLAYELHITNFDSVPLTLERIEIFSNSENSQPLQSLSGDALSATILKVGATGGEKQPGTIDPGRRVVAFLWVNLALDSKIPRTLEHRLTFVSAGSGDSENSGSAESILEDFSVSTDSQPALVLSPPFRGGVWLAGDGPANDSPHRRALLAIDGHIYAPERFASDWVMVGPNGDSHNGTDRNQDYWAYAQPVLAVADGEITQAVDGIRENAPHVPLKPVTFDNILGNYVILRIASHRYVTYAHLQTGSIKVAIHEHVKRGAVIALLGDSGQSTAPHLHLEVTDKNSGLESEGVPFVFHTFTDLGPGSSYELNKHPSTPRVDVMPGENDVVDFGPARPLS